MACATRHPIIHIGAEVQRPYGVALFDPHFDGEKWRIIDHNAAFLHRRDQVVMITLALEHRGEQLDQRRTPDRRLEIEPGPIGGNPHVEITTERRVPQVDRRRSFAGRLFGGAGDAVEAGPLRVHFFRHDWRYPTQLPGCLARAIVMMEYGIGLYEKNSVSLYPPGISHAAGSIRGWQSCCMAEFEFLTHNDDVLTITGKTGVRAMAVPGGEGLEKFEDIIVRAAESTAAHVRSARAAIGTVIFGQERVVEHALITVLSGGHALLIGVPGLAKTKLVETMGIVLGLDARRIQFTPDLMPSDILGTEVLEESPGGKRSFRFIAGPVFAQLLMADEINRASPRTQSALLQAMQEQHVTVAGLRHDLPKPFHVLATQNPLEQEGTYPLPEAQLDRFLMQIDVDYPDREAERRILFETTGAEEVRPKAAMTAEDLIAAQRLVRRLPVGESVVEAILALVRSARPGPEGGDAAKSIAWGPGPRASQALMLAVRARALLEGRFAPSVDDVLDLATPVLKHRMALTFAARADGETIEAVITRLKTRIG